MRIATIPRVLTAAVMAGLLAATLAPAPAAAAGCCRSGYYGPSNGYWQRPPVSPPRHLGGRHHRHHRHHDDLDDVAAVLGAAVVGSILTEAIRGALAPPRRVEYRGYAAPPDGRLDGYYGERGYYDRQAASPPPTRYLGTWEEYQARRSPRH